MDNRDKSLQKRSAVIHILSFLIISFSKIVGDDIYEIQNIDISFIMILSKMKQMYAFTLSRRSKRMRPFCRLPL